MDVLTNPVDADLKLGFERYRGRSRQARCPLAGDLVEYPGQLPSVFLAGFTSDQGAFGLIGSQGTPPV
jgi:hypothetical protein